MENKIGAVAETGAADLERYIIVHCNELLAMRGMKIYRIAVTSDSVSGSEVYKYMQGKHRPTLLFVNHVCNQLHITMAEFFADYK